MAGEVAELVFIPIPGMGHLPSMVEVARKLVAQNPHQISITFLIMKLPYPDDKIESFIQSLRHDNSSTSLHFLELPPIDNPDRVDPRDFLTVYLDSYKPIIKQTLLDKKHIIYPPSHQRRLAGLVLDMFCTTMIDMANELGAPFYIFFASSAALLRLMLDFESTGVPDITPSDDKGTAAVEVAGFRNPVPSKVWPDIFLDKEGGTAEMFLGIAKRFRQAKGILVNTFAELEPDLLRSLSSDIDSNHSHVPSIYSVGPILNLKIDSVNNLEQERATLSWLDSQPPCSVVFLCFGSRGTFNRSQVKEIADGLERSGQRFLWSIRRNPAGTHSGGGAVSGREVLQSPAEFENFEEVLPQGFLDRTAGIGRVIGWAPQVSVLGHGAVGAFVSHCGWNSTLESLWFGVPMLTWPLYFEQQLNAFVMVRERGLAVEIRMDFKYDFRTGSANMEVPGELVKKGIRKVMEGNDEQGRAVRQKVKELSEMGRKALEAGGSSFESLAKFVEDVFRN